MKTLIFLSALSLSSCAIIDKGGVRDELIFLTDDVLKKGEGIEIDIKPIPKI